MLVVKIELWPGGWEDRKKEIGRLVIVNDGSGTKNRGNYRTLLMRRGTKNTVLREGRVGNHSRLSKSVWNLVHKALESVMSS